MKKIITTIIALTTVTLCFSQSLKLSTEDTINIVGASSDFELIAYVEVENISVEQLNVDIKRTVLSSPTEYSNYFCWSACYLPSVDISLSPIAIGAYDINSAFSGHIRPNGTLGIAKILYTFFNSNDPNDSTSVLVIFNVTPVGIQDLEAQSLTNFYPNPVNNTLNIQYEPKDFNEGASILVFDLTGKEVFSKRLNLNTNKEVIDMTFIQAGVYFYQVTNSKIKSENKKIIIQH